MEDNIKERFQQVARSHTFKHILAAFNLQQKKVLDLGCGYGEYLVKFGANSLGLTTTLAETAYAQQENINIRLGNAEKLPELGLTEKFDAVWANNLLEHLLSPHKFLASLRTVAADNLLIILGVPVIPALSLLMKFKKFRGALAVSHINFFDKATLRLTIERAGWQVDQIRPFIFSASLVDNLVSYLAPHLYVVAHKNPSFKYEDKKIKEWASDPMYMELIERVNN